MCGTPPRPESPPGGSILMTPAPRSRSVFVQSGPASTRVKSITLIPSSGAFISVPLEDGRARTGLGKCCKAALLVVARPHRVVDFRLRCISSLDPATCRQISELLEAGEGDRRARRELACP